MQDFVHQPYHHLLRALLLSHRGPLFEAWEFRGADTGLATKALGTKDPPGVGFSHCGD